MQFPTIEMLPRIYWPKVDLLTIELVPRTCWGSNVRSLVSRGDWNWVRATAYAQAGYLCEIWGGTGSRITSAIIADVPLSGERAIPNIRAEAEKVTARF